MAMKESARVAMKESARVAMIKMKYSASLRRAEFSRARRAASWTTFQLGDVVYFYRVQKMAGRGTKRKRLGLNQWHGPGMIMALEGGKVPTGAYVAYRGNLTKCAVEHLRPASTLERLSAAEWEEILSEVIRASGGPDEPPEDTAEPGDDHDDDHDDYDPTEPDVDRDGDGGGNDDEDQDDQGGGDHPGHDGLVPRTGDAGKTPPAVTYPFPFQASEMIPLLASSAAGSDALLRALCLWLPLFHDRALLPRLMGQKEKHRNCQLFLRKKKGVLCVNKNLKKRQARLH